MTKLNVMKHHLIGSFESTLPDKTILRHWTDELKIDTLSTNTATDIVNKIIGGVTLIPS